MCWKSMDKSLYAFSISWSVTLKGYLRAASPPFLHSSPTQKAAFLLLVGWDDSNSLSTNGIILCKNNIPKWFGFNTQLMQRERKHKMRKNHIDMGRDWSTHVLSNFGKTSNNHCPVLVGTSSFLQNRRSEAVSASISMKEVMALITNTHRKFHQRLKEFCKDGFEVRPHRLCKGGEEVGNRIHEDLIVSNIIIVITLVFYLLASCFLRQQ